MGNLTPLAFTCPWAHNFATSVANPTSGLGIYLKSPTNLFSLISPKLVNRHSCRFNMPYIMEEKKLSWRVEFRGRHFYIKEKRGGLLLKKPNEQQHRMLVPCKLCSLQCHPSFRRCMHQWDFAVALKLLSCHLFHFIMWNHLMWQGDVYGSLLIIVGPMLTEENIVSGAALLGESSKTGEPKREWHLLYTWRILPLKRTFSYVFSIACPWGSWDIF